MWLAQWDHNSWLNYNHRIRLSKCYLEYGLPTVNTGHKYVCDVINVPDVWARDKNLLYDYADRV